MGGRYGKNVVVASFGNRGLYYDDGMEEGFREVGLKLKPGHTALRGVNPPCGWYHYSQPRSQNALICKTKGFPLGYDPETEKVVSAYSDRIMQWDGKRFDEACEIAGGGDQGWASRLPNLTDSRLKEFARVALGLDDKPLHVRVVHHFNVSNGYSCPTVEAICHKQDKKTRKNLAARKETDGEE